MKNSTLTVDIISEEMPDFTVCIVGSTSWPSVARFDKETQMLRFFDGHGTMINESPFGLFNREILPNFGLVFIGVTESTVDFQTKSQNITAKMRAINLDAHEHVHGDNWGYDE
jgi:hypothetical protein